MPELTKLSRADVQKLLKRFGISGLLDHKILSGGQENTNYLVNTSDDAYVLSICEQKSFTEAKNLADLLVHLNAQGYSTSEILITKEGEPIVDWAGKPTMLKRYLHGKVTNEFDAAILKLVGQSLARLHQVPTPDYLPSKLSYGKEAFMDIKKYAPDSEFDHWLMNVLEMIKPYLKRNLPLALIHGDVFCDNVIIADDDSAVTIMDFEEATHYYRIFDIGMCIIGTCASGKTIDVKKVVALLSGYESVLPLSGVERKALHSFTVYAGAAMSYWRYVNFNHTNPTPAKKTHYLGLKVLADDLINNVDGFKSALS